MNERLRVSCLVARQRKEQDLPGLAVLRRAGLWGGWLRREKFREALEDSARNTLAFRARDLERPFITYNPKSLDLIATQLGTDLAAVNARRNLHRPAGRRPALGLNARTLQRQSRDWHAARQRAVQESRRELARPHFAQKPLELNEVAYPFGFNDTNSFSRAFQSWEDAAPLRWRCLHLKQP